jgi:hypothetical protein
MRCWTLDAINGVPAFVGNERLERARTTDLS